MHDFNLVIIKKSNDLVRGATELTLVESRLLLLVAAMGTSSAPLNSFTNYRVFAHTYAELFGVEKSNCYKLLKEAGVTLYQRNILILTDSGKKQGEFRWITSIVYRENEGAVDIMLSPRVIPFLTELKSQYTQYPLTQTKLLNRSYALRLFEIGMSYLSIGAWSLSIEEFRSLFMLSEDCRQDNIQNRILKPCLQQINQTTNIFIKYTTYKVGKKITGFKFTVEQQQTPNRSEPSKVKKMAASKLPRSAKTGWGVSENVMFKELQRDNPILTQEMIEAEAKENNEHVSDTLHHRFANLKAKQARLVK